MEEFNLDAIISRALQPYKENRDYVNMISFLGRGGNPENIKYVIRRTLLDHPKWFSQDFKGDFQTWEDDIPAGTLSIQALTFAKKMVNEYWDVIYKDGTSRVEIYFEDDPKDSWPEDSRRK